MSNFTKICPVGAELFHADRQTDRRKDLTRLTVVFRNFAKAPKSGCTSHMPLILETAKIFTLPFGSPTLYYILVAQLFLQPQLAPPTQHSRIICSILNCFFDPTEYITEKQGATHTKVITYTEITLGIVNFLAWN